MTPTKVKLLKAKNQVHFYYEDGKCLILDGAYLRSKSPSAENKNNLLQSKNKFLNVKVVNIKKVGNYALRFIFDDDHKTGIYSWDYLVKIGNSN
tara:strand:+ start:296 stop:577 length:282 start_codon:yes stop_codon:yes gene_type:complete